jgi:hypothetical protein
MIKEVDGKKALLFDADVIFHFISGDKLLDLFNIFPNECYILDKVYEEVTRYSSVKTTIDNQISIGLLKKVQFPSNLVIIKEYAHLTSKIMNMGKGESACMAYCKFTKDIIASSNLKDIARYCGLHQIDYLTTMDFIAHAFLSKLWTENECNSFVGVLVSKRHKLPCSSFTEYKKLNNLSLSV